MQRRRSLLRWSLPFLAANIAIWIVLALRYLQFYQSPGSAWLLAYVPLILVSHFTILATAVWIVTFVPLLMLAPRTRYATLLAAATFGIAVTALMLDVDLFVENQYHLNPLNAQILAPSTWIFAGVFFVIAFFFQLLLARLLARSRGVRAPVGWLVAAAVLTVTVGAQLIHIWADATYYVPVTSVDRFLPAVRPFTAQDFLVRNKLVNNTAARERALSDQLGYIVESPMAYPKRPLKCAGPQTPTNVVFIIVDTLRADMLNAGFMPRTAAMADGMDRFLEHYSGGNATTWGLFSLFYGLPGTYWTAVDSNQLSPLLIDQFIDQHYEVGLFATHDLYRSQMERTAFVRIPDLKSAGGPASEPEWKRDANTVAKWNAWLAERPPGVPFLGIVMLNSLSVHSAPEEYFERAAAARPGGGLSRQERYHAIASYVDQLIASAVDSLVKTDHWSDSIVIITSDHGEEFDDSGQGYWGHGKAYDRWHLHVPMLVRWPGRAPEAYSHRTSHLDVVPTLLQDLFACSNGPADYATGKNMFNRKDWDYIVAGGYYAMALIEPDRVTLSYKGSLEVRDSNYQLMERPRMRRDVLARAVAETSAFFQVRPSP